ncbi:sigma-70 family RNA polymerase sigma factor [Novipirellula artificiosorum]|uniref:RNA polymerase sigma factor n=1 Tax=Novipirellula artificiosorum TaxID=2528016 RepID=A0A5C6E1Y3_9BACT|nr:sigma-70 family RNA polymerase sigma factor [Novipirellula artificiosorum]TWU42725.1 RNA polymerase sigma factor [Novipirellula artificiosorum]
MGNFDATNGDPESSLRHSWSIGPLRPWLLRIAVKEIPDHLRGKIDPSDVVQQTLLDAWRGDAGFRGSSHAQRLAWLRVILRRVVLQNQRGLRAAKRGDGIERVINDAINRTSVRIEDIAVGKEPKPDEAVEDAEQNLLVSSAIERLPEEYQRVIELRHFEHFTHAEIASKMERSPAAIRMLWIRALIALRQMVDKAE